MLINDEILSAKVCPYCFHQPSYIDSKHIYGKSYGMVYYCKNCDAYVGVHKGTDKALGRLANKELREAKKKAHFYFDQLWQRKIDQGYSKKKARKAAYNWLSEKLGIPFEYTHIGMFDVLECQSTVELCKPYCKNKDYDKSKQPSIHRSK